MRKWINEYGLLAIIVFVAFITRLVAANLQSFSNDELSALYRLQFSDFNEFIHWGVKVDGHPAFVQLFLYAYSALVPNTEFWIRLPFVLAGTISLVFIFFGIKKLSGDFSAYLVTIIMAFASFSIQLGYFARPYAFGILFSSAAAYYWIVVFLEKKKGIKPLIGFIIFSLLAAYTHYFALLEIVVLGMATFLFVNRRYWWKIIVSGAVVFLAFLPHYPVTAFQLSVGGIGGWLGKPGPEFLLRLIFTFFDFSWLIVSVMAVVTCIMLMFYPNKPHVRNFILLIFLSMVPFLILYQYSVRVNSVLQLSACYFFMPYLLSGLVILVEPEQGTKQVKWLAIPVFIAFLVSAFFINPVFKPIHFAEFKRIAAYIEEHENDSVTTIVAVNNPAYIDFYLKDKKPDLYITDMGDNLSFLLRYIDTCSTQELIYAFANQRSNTEIPYLLASAFGDLTGSALYVNSAYYHFKRDTSVNTTPVVSSPAFVYNAGEKAFIHVQAEHKQTYSSYTLLKDGEFGPTLNIKLSDYDVKPYHTIVSKVQLSLQELCDVELVLSVENKGKVKYWRSRRLYQQLPNVSLRQFESDKQLHPSRMFNLSIVIAENMDNANIDPAVDDLKIYLWNPNHCECLVNSHAVWIFEDQNKDDRFSQ